MTSQLNVDTIVDKAGTGGTNVKVANNAVAVAEGGSATTTVVQGLCKAWGHYDHDVLEDSFNLASTTDNGTGDYTLTLSSIMANVTYCPSNGSNSVNTYQDTGDSTHNWTNNYSTSTYALGGMGGHDAGTRVLTTTAKSASSISVALSNSSQAGIDENDVSYIGHGDLA